MKPPNERGAEPGSRAPERNLASKRVTLAAPKVNRKLNDVSGALFNTSSTPLGGAGASSEGEHPTASGHSGCGRQGPRLARRPTGFAANRHGGGSNVHPANLLTTVLEINGHFKKIIFDKEVT